MIQPVLFSSKEVIMIPQRWRLILSYNTCRSLEYKPSSWKWSMGGTPCKLPTPLALLTQFSLLVGIGRAHAAYSERMPCSARRPKLKGNWTVGSTNVHCDSFVVLMHWHGPSVLPSLLFDACVLH